MGLCAALSLGCEGLLCQQLGVQLQISHRGAGLVGNIRDQGADLIFLCLEAAGREGAGRQILGQPALQSRKAALVKVLLCKRAVHSGGEHLVQPGQQASGTPAAVEHYAKSGG